MDEQVARVQVDYQARMAERIRRWGQLRKLDRSEVQAILRTLVRVVDVNNPKEDLIAAVVEHELPLRGIERRAAKLGVVLG